MQHSSEPAVIHDAAAQRFELTLDGHRSVCDYEREDGRMIFTHTYVPGELRGRGVAERLVRAGLAFAQAEGLRVVPQCSYVAAFVARHPEFQALLAS